MLYFASNLFAFDRVAFSLPWSLTNTRAPKWFANFAAPNPLFPSPKTVILLFFILINEL